MDLIRKLIFILMTSDVVCYRHVYPVTEQHCKYECKESRNTCKQSCYLGNRTDSCIETCERMYVENECVTLCFNKGKIFYPEMNLSKHNCCLDNQVIYFNRDSGKRDFVIVILADMSDTYGLAIVQAFSYHVNNTSSKTDVNIGYLVGDTSCINPVEFYLDVILNPLKMNSKMFDVLAYITFLENDEFFTIVRLSSAEDALHLSFVDERNEVGKTQENQFPNFIPLKLVEFMNVELLLDVIKLYGLYYVTIVYEDSLYGQKAYDSVVQVLKQSNVCISDSHIISKNQSSITHLHDVLRSDIYSQLIVLIVQVESDGIYYMKQFNKLDKVWFHYVQQTTEYHGQISSYLDLSDSVFFTHNKFEIANTSDGLLLETQQACIQKNSSLHCHLLEQIDYPDKVAKIFLQNVIRYRRYLLWDRTLLSEMFGKINESVIAEGISESPDKLLLSAKLTINKRKSIHSIGYRKLGDLQLSTLADDYNNYSLVDIGSSACEYTCMPGTYSVFIRGFSCCWTCRRCPENHIKTEHGNENTCLPCTNHTVPDTLQTSCLSLQVTYHEVDSNNMYLPMSLSIFGVVISVFILYIFIKFFRTPIVRSSNLILSVIQLLSHLLIFLSLLLYFPAMTKSLCITRPLIFGFLSTIMYTMILIKEHELFFVFHAKQHLSKRQVHVEYATDIGQIVLLVSIQGIITYLTLLHEPITFIFYRNRPELLDRYTCNYADRLYLVQIGYSLFLSILCIIQAIRCRNLPRDFNDTKLILIAMFLSQVILISHFPVHFSSNDPSERAMVEIITIFVWNLTVMLITYSYKIYLILLRPQRNRSATFDRRLTSDMLHVPESMLDSHLSTSNVDFSAIFANEKTRRISRLFGYYNESPEYCYYKSGPVRDNNIVLTNIKALDDTLNSSDEQNTKTFFTLDQVIPPQGNTSTTKVRTLPTTLFGRHRNPLYFISRSHSENSNSDSNPIEIKKPKMRKWSTPLSPLSRHPLSPLSRQRKQYSVDDIIKRSEGLKGSQKRNIRLLRRQNIVSSSAELEPASCTTPQPRLESISETIDGDEDVFEPLSCKTKRKSYAAHSKSSKVIEVNENDDRGNKQLNNESVQKEKHRDIPKRKHGNVGDIAVITE